MQQILRVAAQPVAAGRRRSRGGANRAAVSRRYDDLLPTEPARIGLIVEPNRRRAAEQRTGKDDLEARRVQAPLPLGMGKPSCDRGQSDPPAADGDVKSALDAPQVRGLTDVRLGVLERRDLGEIEHVRDVQPVARELELRRPVDREVAERMRRGDRRRDESRQDRDRSGEERKALHDVASAAASRLQRIENCGFRASALRNQTRASDRSPRQRSM